MEEELLKDSIPYHIVGGLSFYSRKEIKDLLAYLKLIYNEKDDVSFLRVINTPKRGIGLKTIQALQTRADINNSSLFDAIDGGKEQPFKDLILSLKKVSETVSLTELIDKVLDASGIRKELEAEKSIEAEVRLENLKELVTVMGDTEKYPTMGEFLEHVSLVMDNDDALDSNKVMLITLHSAKGLEFDVVFLPGWEEGLFPHQRSLDEGGTSALEEERRLAYVAITRAKQQLYILTALNRRIYGQWQNNIPSRFINELPPSNIEICNNVNSFYSNGYGSSYGNGNSYNRYNNEYDSSSSYNGWYKNKRPSQPRQYNDNNRFSYVKEPEYYAPRTTNNAVIGMRVYHTTFGYGKVVSAEGNKLEIMFDNYGHKKLHKDYVTKV